MAAASFTLLLSCRSNSDNQRKTDTVPNQDTVVVDNIHNAETSLDFFGTYAGTTPCADCPGIKTEIMLNKDSSYTKSMLYLERNEGKPFIEKGKWKIKRSLITLLPNDNSVESKLFVGENYIQLLDADGNKITGSLEKMYILHKK